MKTDKNIQDKIDNTFSALNAIEQVAISPFFKDKTLQRLFTEKEETSTIWSWFTPQLQLATLVCFVVVNLYTFQQMKSEKYNESISSFASEYGLSSETDSSFFNF